VIQKRESPHGSGPDTPESRPWPDLEGSPLMPSRRLRAWLLAAFSLTIACMLALAAGCFIGAVLSVGWILGDPLTVQPGLVVALVSIMIVGLISVGVFVVVSVALLTGDRFVSLRLGGRSLRPRLRLRLRTLVGSVAAIALCLGVIVFADRSSKAYHTARAHEAQATTYRWLLGIDSDAGRLFWRSPPPDPKMWSSWRLRYYRAMERYHDGLRRKYDTAAYRPWLSVPSDPPEPREPDWRLDVLEEIWKMLWKILLASRQSHYSHIDLTECKA
jgi:hypothetical protein